MKILFILLSYIVLCSVEGSIDAQRACICAHGCYLPNNMGSRSSFTISQDTCQSSNSCIDGCRDMRRGAPLAYGEASCSASNNDTKDRSMCALYGENLPAKNLSVDFIHPDLKRYLTMDDNLGHTLGIDFIIGPESSSMARGDNKKQMLRALQIPTGAIARPECRDIWGNINGWGHGLANVGWRLDNVLKYCLATAPDIQQALTKSVCEVLIHYRKNYRREYWKAGPPDSIWYMINAGSRSFIKSSTNEWKTGPEYTPPSRVGNWSYVYKFNEICGVPDLFTP